MEASQKAFEIYQHSTLQQRATLLHQIGDSIQQISSTLIEVAATETHLSHKRLLTEIKRTIFQLQNYGDYCATGEWMDIRIDTHNTSDQQHLIPDLRKMMVPLGPVLVFGAANFPFAYSTAGGDTASGLAAGCSVVVKAHPGHVETGKLVAAAVREAIKICNWPEDIFIHIEDISVETGEALVKHPLTKAVGFTGSYKGGKQIFDWGNQREIPIPVFAEMSSVNPVFILPEKLAIDGAHIAQKLAASITLDVGQFCTNPGIIVCVNDEAYNNFETLLVTECKKVTSQTMLNKGIGLNFKDKKQQMLQEPTVTTLIDNSNETEAAVTIAKTTAQAFLANIALQDEVFGPFSLMVCCKNIDEMQAVAQHLKGQLTATIFTTDAGFEQHPTLMQQIKNLAGRIIFNNVPTGVTVCLAMQHGGPFPSSTDSRFTSVGADGMKRFARPQTYQNWPNALLPKELQNENPLGIFRTVNNTLTKAAITPNL